MKDVEEVKLNEESSITEEAVSESVVRVEQSEIEAEVVICSGENENTQQRDTQLG